MTDWAAVETLVSAFKERRDADVRQIEDLFRTSAGFLKPLSDPLTLQLAAHRALRLSREEVYSDWLAWTIERLQSTANFLRLVGSCDQVLGDLRFQAVKVIRELPVPHGHHESAGRLDMAVLCGSYGVVVVELKRGDIEAADTKKQEGYRRWADGQGLAFLDCVIIAKNGPDLSPGGFRLRSWREVCLALRRASVGLMREDVLSAASILLFVGAIENSILRYGDQVTGIRTGARPVEILGTDSVVSYLREWHQKAS